MNAADRQQILKMLSASKDEIRRKCRVRSLYVFGSFARGDATETSDVDILVDFDDNADLFDLTAVGDILEDRLGRKVDVVSRNGLNPLLRDVIELEARPV